MKWIVTGAGGYIGAHLLDSLLVKGQQILPLVGKSETSASRLHFLNVNGMAIDLSNRKTLLEIFQNFRPDIVVHLASLKSPEESNRKPHLYLSRNLESLANVFNAALESGARIFINASSSSIYGDLDSKSIKETDEGEPISAYGLSKRSGEIFLDLNSTSEMQTCSLRFFNVIGAKKFELRERATFHLVPATISRILSGCHPVIYGHGLPTKDGTPLRDYIHVSDSVRVIEDVVSFLSKEANSRFKQSHLKLNVGSGIGTSVLEIVNTIQNLMESKLEPILKSARDGDPIMSIADISAIKSIIGFEPRFQIEEMIKSCLAKNS